MSSQQWAVEAAADPLCRPGRTPPHSGNFEENVESSSANLCSQTLYRSTMAHTHQYHQHRIHPLSERKEEGGREKLV
jgi:hypothetical protein